jgi:hypothetical protein
MAAQCCLFSEALICRRLLLIIPGYTIWGQAFDGRAISILECSRSQKTTTFGVAETENWKTPFVFLGGLVPDRTTPFFISVSAEVEGLREWIGIDGGELSLKTDGRAFDYHYEDPATIIFSIKDNIIGSIYFRNSFWGNLSFKSQSEQFTRLQFESTDKHNLDDLIVLVRNFRKLISFFIGQKVRIKQMVFASTEVQVKLINPTRAGEQPLKEIFLFFKDNEEYGTFPQRPIYFINFDDIALGFGMIVGRWFEMLDSPVAPVTSLLLDAITDRKYFEENDFLRAWQGVEAFHRIVIQDTEALKRKFTKWYSQVSSQITDKKLLKKLGGKLTYGYEMPAPNRLMELLKANQAILQLSPVTAAEMDIWIKEMASTRNYLTHFEPTMSEKKASPQRMFYYTSLLKALMVVLILRHLGVKEELLKKLTSNPIFYYRPLIKK